MEKGRKLFQQALSTLAYPRVDSDVPLHPEMMVTEGEIEQERNQRARIQSMKTAQMGQKER